jgi:hypothetical protein
MKVKLPIFSIAAAMAVLGTSSTIEQEHQTLDFYITVI